LEQEIDIRELIEVILRGKVIIAGITILAILIAGTLSFFVMSPTYEATATLMVSPLSPKKLNVEEDSAYQALLDSLSRYPQLTMETYRAEVKNPVILKELISDMKLDLEKYTISSLAKAISVEAVQDTNLVRIKVKNTDPALASNISNKLSQKFVAFISKTTKEQLGKSAEFIKQQLDQEKINLDAATTDLKEFLAKPRGVSELRQEIDSKITQVTNFKTQLVDLEVEEETITAAIGKTKEELANQPKTLVTEKSIMDDQLMEKIADETGNLSLDNISNLQLHSEEVNPIYLELSQTLANDTIKLSSISAQRNAIKERITENQKQLEALQAELAEKEVTYEQLQRQVELSKENYNTFLEKYQESKVTQSAKIGEANIMVVSPAMIPEQPVSPNKKLNVAIAAVLGLMLSVFLVFFKNFWQNSASTNPETKTTNV